MKNNQILAALTGIFVLCAFTTLCVFWKYRSSLNRLNQTQVQATYVKNVEGPAMQSLLNDTTEYSKKNPAVVPVLLALSNNMVMARQPAAAPKSGTK
jgi:hypothetical protein